MEWKDGFLIAVTAVVSAIGGWVITLIKTRADLKRQEKTDEVAVYETYANRQASDISELKDQVRVQSQQIFQLQESEKDCLRRHAEAVEKLAQYVEKLARQDGVIDRLTNDIRRLQSITCDTHPGVTATAIVIASCEGVILAATAAVAPLLHWMPDDLKGKSVDVLVPARSKEQYRAGLERLRSGVVKVDPGKPIRTMALQRDGGEVAVVITLSTFKSPMGSELVTAEIMQAPSPADEQAKSPRPEEFVSQKGTVR